MKETIYKVARDAEKYKIILESSSRSMLSGGYDDYFGIKKDYITNYTNVFTNDHSSKSVMYLNSLTQATNERYIIDGCKYFCYWLYYDVLKKDKAKNGIFTLCQNVLKGFDDGDIGEGKLDKYINLISENEIVNFIELSDMYENFYNYKNGIAHPKGNKCNYAKESLRLYDINIKTCRAGNDYEFCYELDNFKEEYERHMLSDDQFPDLPKILESYTSYDPRIIALISFVILLSACFLIFMLFKFTPFRSMFRPKIRKQKKMMEILNDESLQFPNRSNVSSRNKKTKEYNITYYSG